MICIATWLLLLFSSLYSPVSSFQDFKWVNNPLLLPLVGTVTTTFTHYSVYLVSCMIHSCYLFIVFQFQFCSWSHKISTKIARRSICSSNTFLPNLLQVIDFFSKDTLHILWDQKLKSQMMQTKLTTHNIIILVVHVQLRCAFIFLRL